MKGIFVLLLSVLFLAVCIPSEAGDAFIKGGWILSPNGGILDLDDELVSSDKWMISGGSDYHVANNVLVGFEIEGAYHSIEFDDGFGIIDLDVVPLNIFGNVKFKAPVHDIVHVFGGVGFDVNMIIVIDSPFADDVESKVAFQFMGGVEIGHSKRFILEFKVEKLFDNPFDFVDYPTRTIFYVGFGF